MEKTDIIIIGAGVVGLAIAAKLATLNKDIVVVEKYPTFGQETSSRNSEVIHAGIYYPKGSLKARLSVEGNGKLYDFCAKQKIKHREIGKMIVATDDREAAELEALLSRGRDNGARGLKIISQDDIRKLEPNVRAVSAILSPSTGILDTHQFMKALEVIASEAGVIFAYGCEVRSITKSNSAYQVIIHDADGEDTQLSAEVIINSAGLHADKIARMIGIDDHRIYYSKGEYFRVSAKKAGCVNRLVYPVPMSDSLGIHTITDLQGQLRLGPNAYYIDEIDYKIDSSRRDEFFVSASRYLYCLDKEDLSPDTCGIRAKVQGPGEPVKDFVIREEKDRGLEGFIDLIGIESPGLAASLAIADYVEDLLHL